MTSMAYPRSNYAYSTTARILHWTTAILVLGLIPVGIALDSVPDGALKDAMFDGHRSVGVLVMVLTLIRLANRFSNPPAPLPADVPAAQRLIAALTHGTLYTLLIASPIVGWLGSSYFGAPLNLFWLVTIPSPFATDQHLAEKILDVHGWLGWITAGVLTLHIAGALYHGIVVKDGVLQRMTGSA